MKILSDLLRKIAGPPARDAKVDLPDANSVPEVKVLNASDQEERVTGSSLDKIRQTADNVSQLDSGNVEPRVADTDSQGLAVSLGLPEDLPGDLLELAAINDAFRKGLISLQAMNLDDDLYWRAVHDLRAKYDHVREPYLGRRNRSSESIINQTQLAGEPEIKQEHSPHDRELNEE